MNPLNIGVAMEQGADFVAVIGIFTETGGAVDITGYHFLGQMRDSTDPNGTPVAEFDFQILDQVANTGQVQWSLPAAEIDAIVTSIAVPIEEQRLTTPFLFDVKMKDTLGKISRILEGIIELSPEATQEGF